MIFRASFIMHLKVENLEIHQKWNFLDKTETTNHDFKHRKLFDHEINPIVKGIEIT